jgi:hypothetical protein
MVAVSVVSAAWAAGITSHDPTPSNPMASRCPLRILALRFLVA